MGLRCTQQSLGLMEGGLETNRSLVILNHSHKALVLRLAAARIDTLRSYKWVKKHSF